MNYKFEKLGVNRNVTGLSFNSEVDGKVTFLTRSQLEDCDEFTTEEKERIVKEWQKAEEEENI
jgi:hypothetical protein